MLVSKYVHNFNLSFNFFELSTLMNELLKHNYYQSKYEKGKIPSSKNLKQFDN